MKRRYFLLIVSIILLSLFVIRFIPRKPKDTTLEYPFGIQNTSLDLFNASPSYIIIPRVESLAVDKGDMLEIEMYITGGGRIDKNNVKVYLMFPKEILRKENTATGEYLKFEENVWSKYIESYNYENVSVGLTIFPPPFYFDNPPTGHNFYNLRIISEGKQRINRDLVAPMKLNINVADNAPSGDNKFQIVLAYTDGEKWYQDKQEIPFHINNPVEENRQNLLIVLAIIALGFPWISEWTKDTYEKILNSRFGIYIKILTALVIGWLFYLILISLK